MIVFTATNIQTQDVFVGTARDSVEEEWASLLSQADGGAEGRFFDQLRELRGDGFKVETWAYSENPAEARASLREAREDLGAEQIRISRQKPAGSSTSKIRSASMKALMSEFEEAMQGDSGPVDEDAAFEGIGERAETKSQASEQETAKDSGVVENSSAVTEQAPAASRHESASTRQQSTVEQKAVVTPEKSALRQSADSDEQAQMNALMARIQMRRRGMSGSSKSKPAKTKAPATTPATVETKEKMATGRTGSSAKEKRIREAIEAERERRESLRQVQGRDEQAEMNAVMARIEMRRIAQKKATSAKSKEAAKARKAAEARAARQQAAQEAEAKRTAQQIAKQEAVQQEAVRAVSEVSAAEPSPVLQPRDGGVTGDVDALKEGAVKASRAVNPAAGESGKARRVSRDSGGVAEQPGSPEEALRHQTRSRQQQAQIRELVAEIEGRRLAQKAEREARAEADRKRREARARRQSARKEVAEAVVADAEGTKVEVVPQPKPSGPKVQADTRVPTRLASGRTGSAAKERRIREAIEQEKAMREANLKSRRAEEADEMAAILSRLDARGKEAERIKRRR